MNTHSLSLNAALEIYLDDCADRGEAMRTVEGKRSQLNCFLRWCRQQHVSDCEDLSLPALELYRHHVSCHIDKRRKKPLDIATQRNRLTAVKVFLRRLHYLQRISTNPAAFFTLPIAPKRLPSAVLTEQEVELILEHSLLYGAKGLRDRAILEIFYATGIRRMELASLMVTDVDLQGLVLRVHAGKGGRDRCVPIAKRTRYWIHRYLEEVRPVWAHHASGTTVFLSSRGSPLTPGQVSRLGGKYVQRAGVNKPGACHLWRHSAATLMLENGAGLREIQEMLGHASISTTQIYTHITIKQLTDVYRRCHPAARSQEGPRHE